MKAALRTLVRRVACRWRPATLVLAYHHVGDARHTAPWVTVSSEQFAAQMAFLAKSQLVIPLDRLLANLAEGWVPPGGNVVVTFDDATNDTFAAAFPILRHYGVPATVFIPTGLIGRCGAFWWNRLANLGRSAAARGLNLGEFLVGEGALQAGKAWTDDTLWRQMRLCDEGRRRAALDRAAEWLHCNEGDAGMGPMGWEELAQLDATGLLTFGAHSVTHPVLALLSEEELRAEVLGSRDRLAGFRSFRKVFAYPYGDDAAIGPVAQRIVREAGFEAAFTTEQKALVGPEERMALGRVCIDEMSLDAFRWSIDHYLRA